MWVLVTFYFLITCWSPECVLSENSLSWVLRNRYLFSMYVTRKGRLSNVEASSLSFSNLEKLIFSSYQMQFRNQQFLFWVHKFQPTPHHPHPRSHATILKFFNKCAQAGTHICLRVYAHTHVSLCFLFQMWVLPYIMYISAYKVL